MDFENWRASAIFSGFLWAEALDMIQRSPFCLYEIVLWTKDFTKTGFLLICPLSSSRLITSTSAVSCDSLKTTTPLSFSPIIFSHSYISCHLSSALAIFCFPKSLLALMQNSQISWVPLASARQPDKKVSGVICPM